MDRQFMYRLIALILVVALIIIAVIDLIGDTQRVIASWNYYPEGGSKDAEYLSIVWTAFDDSVIIDSGVIEPINIEETYREFDIQKGYTYRFHMTATDSAGNESLPPYDYKWLDVAPPNIPKGFNITK